MSPGTPIIKKGSDMPNRHCISPLAALIGLAALLAGCAVQSPPSLPDSQSWPAPASAASPSTPTGLIAPAHADLPESLATGKNQVETGNFREIERGHASWYAERFHGRRTASGERYDQTAMTAAHKTLPFGSLVRVRSPVTGKEIDVRINDRGPFTRGRVIDVSRAAAEALGMTVLGVKQVLLLVPAPGEASRGTDAPLVESVFR